MRLSWLLWECQPKTLISAISQWVCPDFCSFGTGKTRKQTEQRDGIVLAQLVGHVIEERARLPKWVVALKPEANCCVPEMLSMKVEFDSEVMLSMKVVLLKEFCGLIVA